MFTNHLIIKDKNEEVLHLYLDFNYEFAHFNKQSPYTKRLSLYQKVNDYMKERKIKFNGTKIFLVANGIIIGSLLLSKAIPPTDDINPNFKYVEYIKDFALPSIPLVPLNDVVEEVVPTPPVNPTPPPVQTPSTPSTTPKPKVTPPKPKVEPTPAPTPAPTPTPTENLVTIQRSNGLLEQIEFEDYLTGVVAAEMPALFHQEALKAQAVAARTYALKRIQKGEILTDNDTHQNYKDIPSLKTSWGNNFNKYYARIKSAVTSTKGTVIVYKGELIDALFHSTNNGKTENAAQVWGHSYPYLISVNSPWDLDAPSYYREVTKDLTLITNLLGFDLNEETLIEIIDYTDGNSINHLKIDTHEFTGKELRELLGLRSTDFELEIKGNQVYITTRGYGHGVGMSQYGANGMAKSGSNYKEILTHYYPGTTLRT